MRVTIGQGRVQVTWNDRGDPGDPPVIVAESLTYTISDEQTLRDLHACLDFLFERPSS